VDSASRNWIWRFGDVVLDERSLELTVAGTVVALEPKALELLRVLVRRPGEVVTKDELLEAVWPGRVVTEGVLGKAVAKLRAALNDGDGQLLRTAHGYGYRLVADVVPEIASHEPAPSALALQPGQSIPGRRHWVLVRRLGDGGHGEVWLGEHAKTHEQHVFKFARDAAALTALKREATLFRLFLESLGERDDLSPVLDWNFDEHPYFLESGFVPAGSLLDWCDSLGGAAAVPLALRIELVAQVADALAAAHGIGVLHKDLKPANVLVRTDGDATPRACLTDFGSGRLLDPGQLEALGITRMGYTRTMDEVGGDSTSGTPLYLAPEVLSGHAPTIRSDLYALGVMLWQLVIGDLRRPISAGWERAVDDALLREDIAACIDGEVSRRLDSAAALALRLRSLPQRGEERRRLADRDARAAELSVRLARARGRRRWLMGLSAVLLLGLLASGALYVQLLQSQVRTSEAAARAEAINAFLVDDLLGFVDPFSSGSNEPTLRAAIDHAARSIEARFAGQPANEAAVRRALALGHLARGELDAAQAQLERAAVLIDDLEVDADLELGIRGQLAEVAFQRGEFARARELLGNPDAFDANRDDSDAYFHAAALSALVERRVGQVDAAIARFAALSGAAQARYGTDHPATLVIQRHHADSLRVGGRLDEARALSERTLAGARKTHGATDFRLAGYLASLARIESQQGKHERALALLREADALNARVLPPAHRAVWSVREQVIASHVALGHRDDALAMANQIWNELASRPETGIDGLAVLGNLAKQLAASIDLELGIERATVVAGMWQRQHPADLPQALGQRLQLARLLQQAGRWQEAEAHQRALMPIAASALPSGSAGRAWVHLQWAESLYQLGQGDEARAQLDAGLTIAAEQEAGGNPLPDIERYGEMRARLAGLAHPESPRLAAGLTRSEQAMCVLGGAQPLRGHGSPRRKATGSGRTTRGRYRAVHRVMRSQQRCRLRMCACRSAVRRLDRRLAARRRQPAGVHMRQAPCWSRQRAGVQLAHAATARPHSPTPAAATSNQGVTAANRNLPNIFGSSSGLGRCDGAIPSAVSPPEQCHVVRPNPISRRGCLLGACPLGSPDPGRRARTVEQCRQPAPDSCHGKWTAVCGDRPNRSRRSGLWRGDGRRRLQLRRHRRPSDRCAGRQRQQRGAFGPDRDRLRQRVRPALE
jgi:DNA-binding winged helix-turn-helix (wHTH) protein/tetratricopeptide (TPR) repeat protein